MALQDGTYRAKARASALTESSNGTPTAAVEFVVLSPEESAGQSITWYGYLSEKAFPYTVEGLRNCGWTGDDLSDLSGIDANEVSIVIVTEEYEGKQHSKVRYVNKLGGLAVKSPMTADKAKAFAASMKAAIRAIDVAKGAGAKPSGSKPAGAPMADGDVPF